MEDIQQAKLQYKCVVYNQEPIKKERVPLYPKGITQLLTIETTNSFHMLLLNSQI